MLKTKECEECGNPFTNQRKDGGILGDSQFIKARFCSSKCSGVHQRGIPKPKHTEQWKKEASQRAIYYHAIGSFDNIFTPEVRKKMSISAKNKPAMTNETKRKIGDAHRGERNSGWKGDAIGYSGIHVWVKRRLGQPSLCSHCKTTEARKYEWASIEHKYLRDLNNWVRLCTRCHRNYDNGNIILSFQGKPQIPV